MARFDEGGFKPDQAPSFLGYSQGTDRAQPNKALGLLFEGIADIGEQAIQGVDTVNKQNIEKLVYNGVDKIRDEEFGVNAAVDMQNTPVVQPLVGNDDEGTPLPPAIDQHAKRQMEGLTEAMNQGKLTDLQYSTRLTALSRSIRAQYPGYRSEIDQMIRQVTGMDPANETRRNLLQAWEQGQAQARKSKDDYQSFKDKNLDDLPDGHDDMGEGEVREYVRQRQKQRRDVQDASARMENAVKMGNASKEKLTEHATTAVSGIIYSSVDKGMQGAGWKNFQNRVMEYVKTGKAPSEEEANQIRAGFLQLKSELTQAAYAPLRSQIKKEDGTVSSVESIIGVDAAKKIVDSQLGILNEIESAITSKDFGALGILGRKIESMKDESLVRLYQADPIIPALQALRSAGGDNLAALVYGEGENLRKITKVVSDVTKSKLITGQGGTLNEQGRELLGNSEVTAEPKAVRKFVESPGVILTNSQVPEEVKLNTLRAYSGGAKFLQEFSATDGNRGGDPRDSQMRAYQALVNGAITKEAIKLRDKDPEAWNNYKQFAQEGFNNLYRQEISTIETAGDKGGAFTIDCDEATQSFKYNETALGADRRKANAQWGVDSSAKNQVELAVDRFNRGFNSLKEIYSAEGSDVKANIGQFIEMKAMNESKPGIWSKMWDAISGAVDGVVNKPDSSKSFYQEKRTDDSKGGEGAGGKLALYNDEEISMLRRTDDDDSEDDELITNIGDGKRFKGQSTSGEAAELGNLIGSVESGNNYNRVYGKNRTAPLDKMTIAEVMQYQKQMRGAGSPSTAVGKYQVIAKTLRGLVRSGVVDPNDRFDRETQDRIFLALAEGRGYSKWKAGKLTDATFMENLSKEWAGLPTFSTGRSYYAGDGLNASGTSKQNVLKVLAKLKEGGTQVADSSGDKLSYD